MKNQREREMAKEGGKENRPSSSTHDPTQPQRPPDRRIASQTPPAEDQIEGKRFPGRERREEDEGEGGSVVEDLEEDDLRQDAERGEGLKGTGAGRTAVAHVGLEDECYRGSIGYEGWKGWVWELSFWERR